MSLDIESQSTISKADVYLSRVRRNGLSLLLKGYTALIHRLLIYLSFTFLALTQAGCTPSTPTSPPPPEAPAKEEVASSSSKMVRVLRDSLPDGAPKWLKTRITTSTQNKQPTLIATGVVFGIPNRELAINAASSRALHEVSAWLQSSNIQGLKVTDTAFSAEKHWAAARVQVPLPKDWTAPTPLPESRLP
jgi:hypothetical protein